MATHALSPAERQVYVIKTPTFPQFQFEWHPQAKRVYLTRIGSTIGEPIAFEIKDHGQAQMAVLHFLRGYRQRSLELEEPVALIQLT
jgi:hypothetical protein